MDNVVRGQGVTVVIDGQEGCWLVSIIQLEETFFFQIQRKKLQDVLQEREGLSGTILDYSGLSQTISDYLGLSWTIWTIWDHPELSGTISDYIWLSLANSGYL